MDNKLEKRVKKLEERLKSLELFANFAGTIAFVSFFFLVIHLFA